MASENSAELQKYLVGTLQFMQLTPERGIADFILEEDPKPRPIYLWGFLGLFPQLPLTRPHLFLMFQSRPGIPGTDLEQYRKYIEELELPESVKRVESPFGEDPELEKSYRMRMAILNMPSRLLTVGRYDIGETVWGLRCIPGITQQQALIDIQQGLKGYKGPIGQIEFDPRILN